jgi:hypothetical protein
VDRARDYIDRVSPEVSKPVPDRVGSLKRCNITQGPSRCGGPSVRNAVLNARTVISSNGWNKETSAEKPELKLGDVLIVARLDRLSRSLRDVLMIMERIKEAEAGFRSLTEAIDTTNAPGRMMMQMVGAFAEFERATLRERTKAAADAARLFNVHPATVSRILARAGAGTIRVNSD